MKVLFMIPTQEAPFLEDPENSSGKHFETSENYEIAITR